MKYPIYLYIYFKKKCDVLIVEYQKCHFVTILGKLFEDHCSASTRGIPFFMSWKSL